MNTSDAKKLARRLFILFTLVACLALAGVERPVKAWPCNPNDVSACQQAGGRWYPNCCACGDRTDIASCEWDGIHFWNACVGECWLNQ
jgi:hypothetical protein